jgi:hypothetical protein
MTFLTYVVYYSQGELGNIFYFTEKQAVSIIITVFLPHQKIHKMINCSQVHEYYILAELGKACAGLSRWFTARFVEVSVACAGLRERDPPSLNFVSLPPKIRPYNTKGVEKMSASGQI